MSTNNLNFEPSFMPADEPKRNNKNLIIIILLILLLVSWAYILFETKSNKTIVEGLKQENVQNLSSKDSLQVLYDDVIRKLDSVSLVKSKMMGKNPNGTPIADNQEIAKLKAKITNLLKQNKLSVDELAEAKKMIDDLNGKLATYEAEIAQLKMQNQQLKDSNVVLNTTNQQIQSNLTESQKQNEQMQKTIDVASTFVASEIKLIPYKVKASGKLKEMTVAHKVSKLMLNFNVQNQIAQSGAVNLYVIVNNPSKKVVISETMGSGMFNTREEENKQYTKRISFDYAQGTRKQIDVPIEGVEFLPGEYQVEIYHNGYLIGKTSSQLR